MSTSAKFWDKTAEKYARSPVSDEASYQRKLAETQTYFSPEMKVLEFGCGTGTTAIHHAPHVAHIDATDISEKMIAIAREKANDAGVDNVTFTPATLHEFAGAEAGYDAVLGLNILHLLPNRGEVLDEVSRLLKPGGVFVSSTVCLGNSYLRFIKLVEPVAKLLGLMPDLYIMKKSQLTKEVEDAGFSIESQWSHGKGIAVFTVARKT